MGMWRVGALQPLVNLPSSLRPLPRYERYYIERWLEGHCTCPATGRRLQLPVALEPQRKLQAKIEIWAREHAPLLLVSQSPKLCSLRMRLGMLCKLLMGKLGKLRTVVARDLKSGAADLSSVQTALPLLPPRPRSHFQESPSSSSSFNRNGCCCVVFVSICRMIWGGCGSPCYWSLRSIPAAQCRAVPAAAT